MSNSHETPGDGLGYLPLREPISRNPVTVLSRRNEGPGAGRLAIRFRRRALRSGDGDGEVFRESWLDVLGFREASGVRRLAGWPALSNDPVLAKVGAPRSF